jgi:hypothetical protein
MGLLITFLKEAFFIGKKASKSKKSIKIACGSRADRPMLPMGSGQNARRR